MTIGATKPITVQRSIHGDNGFLPEVEECIRPSDSKCMRLTLQLI